MLCLLTGFYSHTLFKKYSFSVILGFRRDIDEICVLLGYYAASNGNPVPTFRDNVSVTSSWTSLPLKMEPIRCPETSVKDYHSTVRTNPEERRSQRWGSNTDMQLSAVVMYHITKRRIVFLIYPIVIPAGLSATQWKPFGDFPQLVEANAITERPSQYSPPVTSCEHNTTPRTTRS